MTDAVFLTAEDFVDPDFIMVRPALVRKLGDLSGVLMIARIQFRSSVAVPDAQGIKWWKATNDEMAQETGLTGDQVRRTLERLVKKGLILWKVENESPWDRTKSYRVAARQMHPAPTPNGSGVDAGSQLASTPDVLPTKEVKEETQEEPRPRAARAASLSAVADEHFPEWYAAYPKKEKKIAARKAYEKALGVLAADKRVVSGQMTAVDILLCAAHAFRGRRTGQDPTFTPHPASWLNAGQWDDEAPQRFISAANRNELVEVNGMQLTRRNAEALERMQRLQEQNPDLLALAAGSGEEGAPW